jgi:N-acetylglucosaminyldiphosphoundecaprenol N-acetyl-beta-D-mannosaminyltransferase
MAPGTSQQSEEFSTSRAREQVSGKEGFRVSPRAALGSRKKDPAMNVAERPRRMRLGRVPIDSLTFAEALDAIDALVAKGEGGTVFTPNVDHVVQAEENERFRDAYEAATLSLVDGMPVLWASRLMGSPLPEKVSGSDLVVPLLERAAARGWRVFFLGGLPGSAEGARDSLVARIPGLHVVGVAAPRISVDGASVSHDAIVEVLREARPDLVLVALGAPKQELFSHAIAARVRPAVLVGIGATLDFIAGKVRRAPPWMSANGLEWLYRLAQEPRRMWRRYLVEDPKFLLILLRELRRAR